MSCTIDWKTHCNYFLERKSWIQNDQKIDLTIGDLLKIPKTYKLNWGPYLFDSSEIFFFSNDKTEP